jgi:YHS domain-containing protein
MENLLYLALFGLALFVMMRFGCGGHGMGHGRHRHGSPKSDDPPRWVAPEKDKDVVCGMIVETVGAKSAVYAGDVYCFCSSACRDKFEAAPSQFAKAAPAGRKENNRGCC